MAEIIPAGWREFAASGSAGRQAKTLELLAAGLADSYRVYHAVHWSSAEGSYAVFGSIDFVVMNRAGEILIIEQASGLLDETPDGLVKRYPGRSHAVASALSRNVKALRQRLNARPDAPAARIDYLFYCPDYRVREPHTAGLPPERIVDHQQGGELAKVVAALLPPGAASPQAARMHRFLCDIIQLETDVSAMIGQARALVRRIAGGLAHWASQLDFAPFRLRVVGTAGSGKTQLALAEYRASIAAGKRPLYLCYNRPLADHFRAIAPPGGFAASYHAFCEARLTAAGRPPDFSAAGAFDALTAQAAALPVSDAWRFDTLIVDEGQDFSAAWSEDVFRHAAPEARFFWLEDPLQNLYARPPLPLAGWVSLRAQSNFRSPRQVAAFLQALLPGEAIEAAGPLSAEDALQAIIYDENDPASLAQALKEAVRLCYQAGFRKEDLALVSFRGRENSRFLGQDSIGPHRLRRFTGSYDLFGTPQFTSGDLLAESVYRFKGQAAPAVILAEIDFATLDEKSLRKLFVGASRAMLKLILIVSPRTASELAQHYELPLAAPGGKSAAPASVA